MAAAEAPERSVMVVRGWGSDRPGIAEAFMKVLMGASAQVLDISQFLLEGSLMFSFVLQVEDQGSMALMKNLRHCAKEQGLTLDFHVHGVDEFDSANAGVRASDSREAVFSIVSKEPITPAMLYEMDEVLCKHACTVSEIEHRSDNKREHNGQYNKVQLRVICPKGITLASLFLGSSPGDVGLQKVAWDNNAEISLRWWNAMNRPNGKSLVVFGLSDVLCPYDVLDQVLIEAGKEASAASNKSLAQANQTKVALLKGVPTDVVDRVIKRLKFTEGARLVCSALKRMGCRLAILTNTGVREIAEHVKQQLGIDYAICQELEVVNGQFTGAYTGVASDVRFRKADLFSLMAEREGIDYENVMVVGEPLKGLKFTTARHVMETFGPMLYFNAAKLEDLTIALYLLGFNGSDVRTLRKRGWEEGPGAEGVRAGAAPAKLRRCMVQVSSKSSSPGQIKQIFSPLSPFKGEVEIASVRQCSLQGGGMCLGLDLRMTKQDPERVIKDLMFACQKHGFEVKDVGDQCANAERDDESWKHHYYNRHVVTLVQRPQVATASLQAVFEFLKKQNANCVKMDRLSLNGLTAISFSVTLPEGADTKAFSSQLVEVSNRLGADIAFQKDDLQRWMRRLVVFDMDSTLIQQEVIDELAKIAGVETEVKKITDAAMNGDLDFFESLKARVALLKGHNAEELFAKVKANLIYTPGAKKLCATLKSLGYKMAVISGGFMPVAREVQRHLGLDYAFANSLDVDDETGLLTGLTSGPVVTPQRKRTLLATIANVEGCDVQQTIAVGDGANDIPMLHTAGLGVAFCAKPKVQAVANFRINDKDLSTVLFLIGVSEHAAERLSVSATADASNCGTPRREE